jgi:hypothetical protein
MSGGSYSYFCFSISDFASEIRDTETNPKRAAFVKLLELVSEAAHDIEWVDSGDYGKGDENKALDAVFSFLSENPEVIQKAKAYDNLVGILKNYFELEE